MTIGPDTILHPACFSRGGRRSAAGCEIHSGARIVDSRIGDRVTILNHCVITGLRDRRRRIRRTRSRTCAPERDVRASARSVGNFVEMKKTVLGAGSKAEPPCLSGRRRRSARTSTSAPARSRATTTASQKNQTVIEDGAFIGSDTQLIAPVTVGERCVRGQRHDDPRRRPAGRARRQRGKATEHRGLGR